MRSSLGQDTISRRDDENEAMRWCRRMRGEEGGGHREGDSRSATLTNAETLISPYGHRRGEILCLQRDRCVVEETVEMQVGTEGSRSKRR